MGKGIELAPTGFGYAWSWTSLGLAKVFADCYFFDGVCMYKAEGSPWHPCLFDAFNVCHANYHFLGKLPCLGLSLPV